METQQTLQWLAERRRPGNWIEIAPEDQIPPDILGWDRTLLHMFQIAFTPEILRRLATGTDQPFELYSAQVLYPPDSAPVVRFNDEIRGVPVVRLTRPVNKDEPVLISDMKGLVSFDIEESELDCGHFTAFWHGSGWVGSFDFRSGRAKVGHMVKVAKQFLATARFSAEQSHAAPSVDNLFSACELISKAHLTLYHNRAAKAKQHAAVSSALNAWGKIGNVAADFVKLFNRLSNARSAARYEAAQVDCPTLVDFEVVEREAAQLEKAVAQKRRES